MVKYTLNILRKGYVLSQAFFSMAIKEGNKLQDWFDVLIEATKHWKFGDETTTPWLFLRCYVSVNIFSLVRVMRDLSFGYVYFSFLVKDYYPSGETFLLGSRADSVLTGRDLCFYDQTNQIKFKIVLIVKFSSWFYILESSSEFGSFWCKH